jgi:uncharacterized protein (DUF433 family)
MLATHSGFEGISCGGASRALLSLREAMVIADVSEKRVRKDIETGILKAPFVTRINDSRLCTHWSWVFTLAAVYGNVMLNGALRKKALTTVSSFYERRGVDCLNQSNRSTILKACFEGSSKDYCLESTENCFISVDKYVSIDFHKVVVAIKPRVGLYIDGLSRVEEDDAVLGGCAVFKGTRLPVTHIGKMVERGEIVQNVLEDYPNLTEDDVNFARLYYRAHPPTGRPRSGSETTDDSVPPAA